MGVQSRSRRPVKHLKVSQKEVNLKRKQKSREVVRDADDLVDNEGYVCLPESEAITAEVEAELAAFRGQQSSIAERLEAAMTVTTEVEASVTQVYTAVGKILAAYRSGKLPKAFKMIPALEKWEHVLRLTSPEAWTPQAMREAVSVFISNMSPSQAQVFLQTVFMPTLRSDIKQHGKLNYHYYTALQKAVYKPAAWFKGVIFPLCEDKNTTLREAAVAGSAIMKVSIPVMHASAALLKMSQMQYTGPMSFVMKSLISKKFALPQRVVHSLVDFFLRFRMDDRKLPLLWHQLLLTFVKLYVKDINAEKRAAIGELLQAHPHPQISSEVSKLLANSLELG